MNRQVVYNVKFAVELRSTGVSSHPDVLYADTPDEAGALVAEMLKRGNSFEWVTVREQEVRA